jgi:hypothetical protein
MNSGETARKKKKTFFAVTSLGKNRWYWVVWPSLALIQSGEASQHLADGYASTKAEAVDQALEVAGMHGEWVAAKYARQYFRQLVGQKRGKEPDQVSQPIILEFLYRDIQDESSKQWYSVPHRLVKKTKKYVYVEQRRYQPEQLTGSWLDHDVPTFRLDRRMLEREGYALTPITDIDDPLFFTTPYQERAARYQHQTPACLRQLDLSFPCSEAEVKAAYRQLVKRAHPDQGGSHAEFLTLQEAYEQALRLCRHWS